MRFKNKGKMPVPGDLIVKVYFKKGNTSLSHASRVDWRLDSQDPNQVAHWRALNNKGERFTKEELEQDGGDYPINNGNTGY